MQRYDFFAMKASAGSAVMSLFATVLVSVLLLGTSAAYAAPSVQGLSQAVPGYAVYRVEIVSPNGTMTATVNESVSTSQRIGEDILSLAIYSANANLTYSRFVNSSDALQPFIPPISGQNLTLGFNSTKVALTLVQNGTTSVTFKGDAYALSTYWFSAAVTSGRLKVSDHGALSVFPSGLLYSVGSVFNGTSSLRATLLATSLPLSEPGSGPALQIASVGLGAAVVGGVLLASLGVRSRRQSKRDASQKPDYWVD